MSGVPFTSFPASPISRFDSSVFRVLLLRRFWLPLPPSTRKCRCGRLLDVRGHHRAACAVVRVLGRRGYPLESAAARVCREAGARVSSNVLVRDLDILPLDRQDGRKLEVVADGLPLFHGAQLAIDTTIVSPLRADGTPRPGSHARGGVALRAARRAKTRTYPELTGDVGRARLVVLATEVGGRWSEETDVFLRQLAKAKARAAPVPLQTRDRAAWLQRWRTILACYSARSFGMSLLEVRGGLGVMGPLPPPQRSWWSFVRPGLLREAAVAVFTCDFLGY